MKTSNMKCSATSHPAIILKHWFANRKHNTEGGMISLDELRSLDAQDGWFKDVPTIVPTGWEPIANVGLPTQEEFNEAFYNSYPITEDFLEKKGTCVAGGSVTRVVMSLRQTREGDVDMYLTEGSLNERQKIIKEFVKGLEASKYDKSKWFAIKGLYHVWKDGNAPIDIILRMYNNMAEIPYGFDIPSGVFDGKTTWFTPAAALMALYKVILVDPLLSSPTYAKRIIKYQRRGFALAFPGADASLFENPNDVHVFGNLQVQNTKIIVGSTVWAFLKPCIPAKEKKSDYADVEDQEEITTDRQMFRLLKGKSLIFKDLPKMSELGNEDEDYVQVGEVRNAYSKVLSDFDIECAVKEKNFEFFARDFQENEYRIRSLMHRFGEKESTIRTKIGIMREAASNLGENDTCDVGTFLDETVEEITAMMKEATLDFQENGLWIKQDPMKQFTSAFQPTPQWPEAWYGNMIAKTRDVLPREEFKMRDRHCHSTVCVITGAETKNKTYVCFPCDHTALVKPATSIIYDPDGQCPKCGQKINPREAIEQYHVSL